MAKEPFRTTLQTLYRQAGYNSLPELAQAADISSWHLYRLQRGLLNNIPTGVMVKLAIAMALPLDELITALSKSPVNLPQRPNNTVEHGNAQEITTLKREYERLENKLSNQEERLREKFQKQALEILEPWLLQWPTAAAAAQQNTQWPALKLLPLTLPLTNLLEQWQVEAIATVGERLAYDPHWHRFIGPGPAPTPGDTVKVRFVGYRWRHQLLYRAKVDWPGE